MLGAVVVGDQESWGRRWRESNWPWLQSLRGTPDSVTISAFSILLFLRPGTAPSSLILGAAQADQQDSLARTTRAVGPPVDPAKARSSKGS